MKKKIFSLLIIFTIFLGFGFVVNAESIDNEEFVIESITFELLDNGELSFNVYQEILDNIVFYDDNYDINLVNLYLNGDSSSFEEPYIYIYEDFFEISDDGDDNPNLIVYFNNTYEINGNINVGDIIVIEYKAPPPPPPPFTIFGFFENFYSNYIFPDNLLDTLTLNLITAVTTLLFFIAVFRGIWSIFRGRKK